MRARGAAFLLAAAALSAAAPASADDVAPPARPPSCAEPADTRAPDPRCGEELDGRSGEQQTPAGVEAARAVLWMPRMASRAVLWPVVQTSGFVERNHLQNWMTALLTSDDGLVGVRPLLTYATSFLPTIGAHVFYRRLPGELGAAARTAGPDVIMTELGYATAPQLGLSGTLGFNRRRDRLFAGIGPNSQDDLAAMGQGNARFASDAFRAELRWFRPLPQRFGFSLYTNGQWRDYSTDDVRGGASVAQLYGTGSPACMVPNPGDNCVDPALVPGFQTGMRILHGGASLAWDGRSHARDGSGLSAYFDATYAHGVDRDPSRHVTLGGELVGSIGGIDRALILRVTGATVRPLSGAPIPFEELIVPSGYAGMRGFPDGRFRGRTGVVGTAEYRWYIASRLDATLFSDLGTVSEGQSFARFRADRWFPTFGVGLRLYQLGGPHWKGKVVGGVEFAYAPDSGPRLLLAVAPF
jgi:hypothetical protein